MILRAIIIATLLPLSGCSGAVALMVLEGLASAATVADKVVGIDISLKQNQANKTPIAAILTPPIAPRAPMR